MSTTIRELEPKEVWNRFADINAVPRPSKKEQKITAFMVDFGKKLGLETTSDAYGNVIIRKPATAGLEHKSLSSSNLTWIWYAKRTMTRSLTLTIKA